MSGAPPPAAGGRLFLPQVESLRGLAALSVALGHCGIITFYGRASSTYWEHLAVDGTVYMFNGAMAVALFFLISGFVLGLSLDRHRAGAGGYFDFLVRRGFRVFPAYCIALMIAFPLLRDVFMHLPPLDPALFAAIQDPARASLDGTAYAVDRLGFLYNMVLARVTIDPPAWTLRTEMGAALLLPLLHVLARRRNAWLDIFCLALFAVLGLAMKSRLGGSGLGTFFLPAFYLGLLVPNRGKSVAQFAARRRYGPALGLLISFGLMIWACQSAVAVYGLGTSFAGFFFLSLLVWCDTGFKRFLLHPLARWNGRLSYSFYVWHYLVLMAATRMVFMMVPAALLRDHWALAFGAAFVVTSAITLLIAWASYSWIERPFIALGRYLLGKLGRNTAQLAPMPG